MINLWGHFRKTSVNHFIEEFHDFCSKDRTTDYPFHEVDKSWTSYENKKTLSDFVLPLI